MPGAGNRQFAQIEPRSVAIIGGHGAMGRLLDAAFQRAGCDTVVADVETDCSNVEAAEAGDLVVVAVPISETEQVIRSVALHVRADACLMDITSLKEGPLSWMLESGNSAVVGAHPMFGPSVRTMQDQLVLLVPGRGDTWIDWISGFFEQCGARTLRMTAPEHDRAMAIIQALRHVATIAFGGALADLDADIEKTLELSSPIYRLETMMAGRLFAQDPELYADISLLNPRRAEVMDALEQAVSRLAHVVRSADRTAFIEEFQRVAGHFGGYRDQAMAESIEVISRLVESPEKDGS